MEKENSSKPIAVQFDKVSFSYEQVPVLDEVSFHFHLNDFVALVGTNGSGKTTLLKLLLGLEKPRAGSIRLLGKPITEQYHKIGYVPQNISFDPAFPITVKQVVKMGRLHPVSRKFTHEDESFVEEALKKADVLALADRPYSALSGGQRRRVMVARALASNPLLLILDEPSANMDELSEKRLFETLEHLKGKTTILIVTHDSTFVSSLTDIAFCVGGISGDYKVRQHKIEPVHDLSHDFFGDKVVRVLHNTSIAESDCCCEGEI